MANASRNGNCRRLKVTDILFVSEGVMLRWGMKTRLPLFGPVAISASIMCYISLTTISPMPFARPPGVVTPLWAKWENATPTPKSGDLESFGTPKNSEDNLRGQISLHWSALYVIEKVLKCKCPQWPHMSHLDICNRSYGQKKGWESNWQLDSRPLKVRNWPCFDVRFGSATWRCKAFDKKYNFASDLVSIRLCSREIWAPKVPGLQLGTILGLQLGSLGKKCHLDVVPMVSCRKYYMGRWWLPPSSGRGESCV